MTEAVIIQKPVHWLAGLVSIIQRSKFASAVGKCRGFCRVTSPFHSICLGNKNAEAVKFLEIKKKVFLELKKKFFVKEKKISFIKKNFDKTQIIHGHLHSLFIPSFRIFVTHYSSALNRSSFPETIMLCIERGY